MDTEECYKSGLVIFHRVQEEFSELAMQIDEHAVDVAISVVIPTQSGLTFDMHLNLQNDDELHLEVGDLWMCWFPCTDTGVVEDYLSTIRGLIGGKFRILETIRGGKVTKARLQVPSNGSWVSKSRGIATFKLPSFRRRSFRVVQNQM